MAFFRENSFFKEQNVKGAALVAIGLVLSTIIAAWTFVTIRSYDNTLVVTGSAKTRVASDSAKWSSSIARTVVEADLRSGYAAMARDMQTVQSFMAKSGVTAEEIKTSPIYVEQVYKYDRGVGGPTEYTLRQTITIESADLDKITNLAKNTEPLINSGVIFSPQAPEYYFSGLSELRVNLLSEAIEDAKARAEKLAETSGSSVGALKSASSGVTQVLAPNSIDVSDYGQYDTSTIEKDVMITVKATFVVK